MELTDICQVAPGKTRGQLPVAGTDRHLSVWTVTGTRPGPTLVLTAGVHGNEYVGIVSLRRLFDELDPADICGRVLMVPVVNEEGFHAGAKRVVPTDGKNLNAIFPVVEPTSVAEHIAWTVQTQIYPEADFLLDLHGGEVNESMCPLVFFPAGAGEEMYEKTRAAASHLEVGYRVRSFAINGLYSNAVREGIPAMLMEVGGLGRWSEELVAMELRSLKNLMAHLGLGGEPHVNEAQREVCHTSYHTADAAGLWFPAAMNGERVAAGEELGHIEDLEGHVLDVVEAEFDGTVLYNTVALGVRAGDHLVAFGEV